MPTKIKKLHKKKQKNVDKKGEKQKGVAKKRRLKTNRNKKAQK